MYKELLKSITLSVSFHEVENHPQLLLVHYDNGYGKGDSKWLVSKKEYLKICDTEEAQDPDFWVKNSNKWEESEPNKYGTRYVTGPTPTTQIWLVTQEFLDNSKRFWEGISRDQSFGLGKALSSKDRIPVYISHHNHSVYDIDGKPMRLPQRVIIRGGNFYLGKVKEHLKTHPEVISIGDKEERWITEPCIMVDVKTENLPIPKEVAITNMMVEDNFIHQYGKYASDFFGINQFKRPDDYESSDHYEDD
jgi:hypothetical protein